MEFQPAAIQSTINDFPLGWSFCHPGLFRGSKGVQLAELGLESWAKRRWVDVPALK